MISASRESTSSDAGAAESTVSLVLISYSYPPVLGGSEIEAQRVCAALRRRGHQVQVLCAGGRPMPSASCWTDPNGTPVRTFGGRWPEHWRGYVYALAIAWRLFRDRHRYQLVYFLMKGAHLATGIPIAGMLGKPVVMKFSGSNLIREMASSRLGRLELRFLRRWASRIMLLNPGMFQEAAAAGLDEARLLWMPNPVDTSEFSPCDKIVRANLRRELEVPEGAQVITFVGRLAPEKELPSLLKSFLCVRRTFPDAMLVLVGDGPGRGELERMADELGVASGVRFTGQMDAIAVRKWLQASDTFALVSSLEGLPCSLIEAMAVGLPSVVTGIPAMVQIVDHDVHGLVVEPRNEEAIAQALMRLLEDHQLRARLGAAARQRTVEMFSTSKVTGIYEDLFRDLLRDSA